ncbi:TIGR02594 family protein [Sulfitobacter pseudonitzschiae]|uniref:TIGR02594 family protein n=1 Tax=Pseudosulfitobacter pseudonitzschiae TaxID=1402135 RepID=A0A9Q2S1R3_9RHOB|nr:TIGR02594 family protein [Pseudosulfitobacter pseudonitzschiae]MBM2293857.1 TIGR02594 family protein [Pseudosulfitobacter pseudonitzschiae]MBM2298774.1 TIGR02594 family protein [Pseudosulfitobacter pseudonitzschiae]MBM2303688.1 TIGR02594 family protein [Pseudosulfitobacter pseudonitzschiae]MBM2313471.1 TIGR02594 family protein [Pseudosulfitobacter pseudonitzschiae]MBM2318385.1 TIGR02594 family protein [Pseudosulfitobacter pseudonitzschiae]
MTAYNSVIFETAGQYLGLEEWPGAKHNPQIVGFFEDVGHGWVKDDETAWCAAFVGSVLAQVGLPNSGKLNARSYLDWGREVAPADARAGDVVVFWRGSPSGWQGHVAFLVRFESDRVIVRGGNQGNKVSDASYPLSRMLGLRRAIGSGDVSTSRPLLKVGSRGVFVMDLQEQLRMLNYHSGALDGQFGSRTRESVAAFQADNGLMADGIVGAKTWKALQVAEPRPLRDHTEQSLAEAGSTTILNARKAENALTTTEGVAAAGLTVGGMVEMSAAAQRAEGALEIGQRMLVQYWPIIIMGLLILLATRYGKRIIRSIKKARVDDAVTGRNLGR